MFEQGQLVALHAVNAHLLQQARINTELSRNLVWGSRERVARSIALLNRTRNIAAGYATPEDGVHFTPPIVIDGMKQPTELRTVSELIEFVRRSGRGTAVLRDEIFIAAALPSAARVQGIRALAVANFRAMGVRVH
jgi:hypothetical protein